MESLLIVANASGHRINSIRLLRWEDIDFQESTIRWRGEQDKTGHEHTTPMVEAARVALLKHRLRSSVPDAASWVFLAPGDSTQALSRHLARDWWERTEAAAGIARVPGRGWPLPPAQVTSPLHHPQEKAPSRTVPGNGAMNCGEMGLGRVELPTSRLSGVGPLLRLLCQIEPHVRLGLSGPWSPS